MEKLSEWFRAISDWKDRAAEKYFDLLIPATGAVLTLACLLGIVSYKFPQWTKLPSVALLVAVFGVNLLVMALIGEAARRRRANRRYIELYEGLRKYTVNSVEPLTHAVDQLHANKREALPEVVMQTESDERERPLGTRERNVLLAMIGVLCKAQGIDISKHAKAAGIIKGISSEQGVELGESTIEQHLKRASAALDSRTR